MKLQITSILLILAGLSARAEEIKVVEAPVATTIYKDSSEFNRMNKKYSVNWELFGVGPSGTSASGASFSYHLDRNNLVQLEVTNGGMDTNWWFDTSRTTISGSSVGAHYKHFTGNSFYYKTGVDYRTIKYHYTTNYDVLANEDYAFKGSSVNASFVIGNQWQWENFTLGCDWIGISAPLTSSVSSEDLTLEQSYTRADLNDSEDKWLKNSYAQVLRFYMGYEF